MVGNPQFKLAFWAAVLAWCLAFNARATTYQEWLRSYARTNLATYVLRRPADRILFVVTAVEGDEASTTNEPRSIFSNVSKTGWIVSREGFVSSFRESGFSSNGGGSLLPTFSGDDLKQLDKLLAKLPGDRARLPPPDRRLLVQADVRGHLLTRVYDRANLPDRLREILRLAKCSVEAWAPQFYPDSKIDSCGFGFSGFLTLSPDREQILFGLMNQPLQFWDPTTHELLAELRGLPDIGSSIAYSPDCSLAVIAGEQSEGFCLQTKTWKVIKKFQKTIPGGGYYCPSWPIFTSDGHHLLLQYKNDLTVFDTADWQRVPPLPEIPAGAMQYIPSPDDKRAIVTLKSGAVVVWDVRRRRSVATLTQKGRLSQVVFSPDRTVFVTVITQTNDSSNFSHSMQLQIWNSGNGRLVKEIALDGEKDWPQTFDHLLWTPDGQHLLAATRSISSGCGIDIFSVTMGRYGGCFLGPTAGINGMALLPGAGQLVAGGHDGKIYFWNFNDDMKKLEVFEKSLRF